MVVEDGDVEFTDGVDSLCSDVQVLMRLSFVLDQLQHTWEQQVHVSHQRVLAVNVEELD